MISIAICEDEKKYINYYRSKINELAKKHNIECEVITFEKCESLLFFMEDHPNKFHIIFLDIITGGITGIDAAIEIRKFNDFTKIIFLTNSKEYVYDSFESNPTEYLLKDVHDDKFEPTFLKAVKKVNLDLTTSLFHFRSNQEDVILELNKITYIESFKRLVIVYMNDGSNHEFYYKLNVLTDELKTKGFILIQRSFLVNAQYIHKISNTELSLKNDVILPISRNLYKEVKETYIRYLNGLI